MGPPCLLNGGVRGHGFLVRMLAKARISGNRCNLEMKLP
jgi:hypothetical protein